MKLPVRLKSLILACLAITAVLLYVGPAFKGQRFEVLKKYVDNTTTRHVTTTFRVYLIPDDRKLKKLNNDQLLGVYSKYTNSLQMMCNLHVRMGAVKDGGKEVCGDDYIVPKAPCIVYSFGCNNEFSFDQQTVERFGCEVHTFDPTMQRFKNVTIPKGVTLHDKGLGGSDIPDVKMYTLATIISSLNHSKATIDVLKIDIETSEWSSLDQMMAARTLDHVKQLLVEFHFHGTSRSAQSLGVLRKLYEYGFRTFSRERNIFSGVNYDKYLGFEVAQLVEMSFINLKYI